MSVSPGWYPDPADTSTQRYWDGEQWVGGAVPVDAEPPAVPPPAVPPFLPASVPAPDLLADAYPAAPTPKAPDSPGGGPDTPGPPAMAGAPPGALRARGAVEIPTGLRFASFGRRFAARAIDIVLVSMTALLVNSYFLVGYYGETAPQAKATLKAMLEGERIPPISDRASGLLFLITFISIAIWFAFEVPGTADRGQTVGKRLVGIRVERLDGSGLSFLQSTRRWAFLALPSIVLQALGLPLQVLYCAWCLWDRPLRQALHDKGVQTIVVRADRPRRTG